MNKKQRLNEMIAHEQKMIESLNLEGQISSAMIEMKLRGDILFTLFLDCLAPVNPRTRATMDTYIIQLKKRLEVLKGVTTTESN